MDHTASFENVRSKSSTLPERVADQISQLIIDRQLTTDDKLPNEFELATQLNVGRGTIREAVKLLIAKNVLVIRRGKGTYIAHNPGEVQDPLGFAYYPDQLRLGLDLLEVRLTLEPWVARMAAERAAEENIEIMLNNCRLVEQDILAGRDHLPNDMEFHVSIANCMHNLVVPKLIPIITYSVRLFGSLNGNTLLSETIVGHRAIADAIASREPEQAEQAMRLHLKQNQIELNAIIQEIQSKAPADIQ